MWKKLIETLDRFSHWMIKKENDLLLDKVNRIFSALLLVNLFLASIFVILAFYFHYNIIAWVTLSVHPFYAFGIYLSRRGYVDVAKIILLIHGYLMLFSQVIINSNNSHVSLYFLPAIICTLLILQGKQRYLGRFISIIGMVLMLISEIYDFPGIGIEISESERFIDLITNVFGSVSITMLAMYFLLKFNDEVQLKLKIQSEELINI